MYCCESPLEGAVEKVIYKKNLLIRAAELIIMPTVFCKNR